MKRLRSLAAGCSVIITVGVITFGSAASGTTPAASGAVTNAPFSQSADDGHPSTGRPLDVAGIHSIDGAETSTAGSGFLAIFQEATSGTATISVGESPPVSLTSGQFTYGPVPAGTYTITASQSGSTIATGDVTVGAGADVTALVYLSADGKPTITGFPNNRASLGVGNSRVVIRNTAELGPVDVYVNGNEVASGLVNNPSSPSSATFVVPSSQLTIEIVPAGKPEGDFIFAQVGVLEAGDLLNIFVTGSPTGNPSSVGLLTNANPLGIGYRLYASDGGVFDFGDTPYFGSMGGKHLNEPIVGAAPTSNGTGYWLVASDGGVFTFGQARFFGSTGNIKLNQPIVGMAETPDDGGYWLVASDGGIFSFGDAKFYGSTGNIKLNQPIVGMSATPDGNGYWLVASDGGIFSFGDANFYGSTGNIALNKPIVSMVDTVDGKGYWLVASDGGVFSFGDASFYGSTGNIVLNKPIVAAITTPDSLGYWLIASDGGVFSFGDANFAGSTGHIMLNKPIVAASPSGAPLPTT